MKDRELFTPMHATPDRKETCKDALGNDRTKGFSPQA